MPLRKPYRRRTAERDQHSVPSVCWQKRIDVTTSWRGDVDTVGSQALDEPMGPPTAGQGALYQGTIPRSADTHYNDLTWMIDPHGRGRYTRKSTPYGWGRYTRMRTRPRIGAFLMDEVFPHGCGQGARGRSPRAPFHRLAVELQSPDSRGRSPV